MRTTFPALRLGAALSCGVISLGVVSCGRTPAATALTLCISGDPKTFDPLQQADENSGLVVYLTGGTLLRIDRVTDQLTPELAESWVIEPGGRAISFRLRPDLRFSDGAPLTADDVARTLQMAFDPKNAAPVGDAFRSGSGYPAVTVASPLEISIRYPVAKAGLDRLFDDLPVIPRGTAKLPPSAGPFFVTTYSPGVSLLLKRNPYYWKRDNAGRQLPYLDSIRLDIQSNRDIEVTRFLRGETDMIRKLDPEEFSRVAKAKPAAMHDPGPSMDAEFLWFNQSTAGTTPWKRKWFTSASFRHAISSAIDREDLARIAYQGHAHPASGPISPANKYWSDPDLKPLPFNRDLALKTLQFEGFVLRDGVLHDRDGHAVEFSLITNADSASRQKMAALIQADLRPMGIVVNIVTLDFGSLIDRIARTSEYDACLLGFTNMAVDPVEQTNFWLSSGEQHAWWPQQKSPSTAWEARIDQLVLAQASEPSRDARRTAFNEVQRIMEEQEPVIYLVNPDFLTAVDTSLRGMRFSSLFPQALANIESVSRN
jgi:peptide/nickel transport system substrate-binding protein